MTYTNALIGCSSTTTFRRTIHRPEPGEAEAFLARAHNLPAPTLPTIDDLHAERAREQSVPAAGGFEQFDIPAAARSIGARVCRAKVPAAVVVNIHASGWTRGLTSWTDGVADVLCTQFSVTSIAPDYRLAPEHPHPAGLDDVYETIRWVLEDQSYGARVFLLGSSAGAHLGMLAALRLRRERPDLARQLRGMVCSYGIYDLSRTPTMRLAPAKTPVVSPVPQAQYLDWAFPGTNDEQRRIPELSPLFDSLAEMPPALFSACERDPLRDDSLFMAARWADAGNETDLDIWADCVHSFDRHYPVTGQRYAARVGQWIEQH